jgi:hypothetical protein
LVVLVAAGGFAGWRWLRPSPTPVVDTAHAPVQGQPNPRPPPAEPVRPAMVHITIESNPSGAEIFRASDGMRIGVTPVIQELPRGDVEAGYVLRLRGYRDAQVNASLAHDLNKVIALERAAPLPAPKPKTKTKNAKPIKNGVMDPFAN